MFEKKIDNRYIWTGISLAILANILNAFLIPELSIASLLCSLGSSVCFVCDFLKLKSTDSPRPHWAWLVVFPVYIWKRSTLLDRNRIPFWASVGVLVLWLGVTGFVFTQGTTNVVAESARPVVTELVQQNLDPSLECTDVVITEETRPGRYVALATISNGQQFKVRIKVKNDGRIFVQAIN